MSRMLRVTSVEMLHKTQNFAPFDPKCWYNVRKIKKDKLPCVLVAFSCTLFWRFQKHTVSHLSFLFPSSVFLHYINICGQNLQNPVLISISTDHFNQVESRRYVTPGAGSWLRTVNVSITCRVRHHDASNSSNGLPVISGSHATHWNNEKAEPRPQGFSLKNGRGGKRLFFFWGKARGTSLDKAPQQPPLFFFSLMFPLFLILFCLFTTKYQWNKRING